MIILLATNIYTVYIYIYTVYIQYIYQIRPIRIKQYLLYSKLLTKELDISYCGLFRKLDGYFC